MRVISYMSESGLGLDIFIYSFAFAVILLLCGVNFRKRILSAISYYLGIISICIFLFLIISMRIASLSTGPLDSQRNSGICLLPR